MLLNYHIGRFVLSLLCVGDLVRLGLSGARVAGFSLQHGHHSNQPATRAPLKPSRKLLMMDILMSETC